MGVTRYWRYTKENMEDLISKGRVIQTRPGAVAQYRRYLDEMPGIPIQSLWDDLPAINNRSSELLGYPTQKPESLLERILNCRKANGATALFTSRELQESTGPEEGNSAGTGFASLTQDT
jgi:hypothetical protein